MVSACSSLTFSSPDIAPIIRILIDKRNEQGRKIGVNSSAEELLQVYIIKENLFH